MNTNDTTTAMPEINFDMNRRLELFFILIPMAIISLCSALFIFAFFLTHQNPMLIKSLHYHAIFLLTIVSILFTAFDLPFHMSYLQLGEYIYRSVSFCFWWLWFDYTLTNMSLLITVVASIQRHILVFHSQSLQVRKKRILFHYVPLIFCVIYSPSFYIVFIFIYPCNAYFDPSTGGCAIPCYLLNPLTYNIDWFLHSVLTVTILVIANFTLILRVVFSMGRVRRQGSNNWKRQRKLTLQLLSFTSLYFLVYIPNTIISLLMTFVYEQDFYRIPSWFFYVMYLVVFICPIQVVLFFSSLPELRNFIRRRITHPLRQSFIGNTFQVQPLNAS